MTFTSDVLHAGTEDTWVYSIFRAATKDCLYALTQQANARSNLDESLKKFADVILLSLLFLANAPILYLWKHQKTKDFHVYSGGIVRNLCQKWVDSEHIQSVWCNVFICNFGQMFPYLEGPLEIMFGLLTLRLTFFTFVKTKMSVVRGISINPLKRKQYFVQ